jgi:membrane-associated protease RseP (regulator of RpoE activity)
MKMPPLTIFGVPVESTVWDVLDLPSSDVHGDGTVGFGFLSNFNITFDYTRRLVWFDKWRTPVENSEPGETGIFAAFDPQVASTVVERVSPGSPADEAGIKEGDKVLSVDGVDMVRPTSKQLRKMLEGPIGSKVDISLSRHGGLIRKTLVRIGLFNQ